MFPGALRLDRLVDGTTQFTLIVRQEVRQVGVFSRYLLRLLGREA